MNIIKHAVNLYYGTILSANLTTITHCACARGNTTLTVLPGGASELGGLHTVHMVHTAGTQEDANYSYTA